MGKWLAGAIQRFEISKGQSADFHDLVADLGKDNGGETELENDLKEIECSGIGTGKDRTRGGQNGPDEERNLWGSSGPKEVGPWSFIDRSF